MNLRNLSAIELSEKAREMRRLLAEGELVSLHESARADMLAKFETAPDELDAATAKLEAMKRELKAQVAKKNEVQARVLGATVQMQNWLKAVDASDEDFRRFGLDPPAAGRTRVFAADPSNLTATRTAEGNKLKFLGNNASGTVNYQIYRQEGESADWIFYAGIRKQHFLDENVHPGVTYTYKIKAQAATNESAFSNTAIVSG